jgi:hypothetical protein
MPSKVKGYFKTFQEFSGPNCSLKLKKNQNSSHNLNFFFNSKLEEDNQSFFLVQFKKKNMHPKNVKKNHVFIELF